MEITHTHTHSNDSSYVFAMGTAKELIKGKKMAKANDKRLIFSFMIRKFLLMILLTEASFKAGNNATQGEEKTFKWQNYQYVKQAGHTNRMVSAQVGALV